MNMTDLEEKEEAVKEHIINEILGQMDETIFDEEEKTEHSFTPSKPTITDSMARITSTLPKLYTESSKHPVEYKILRKNMIQHIFNQALEREDNKNTKSIPQINISDALQLTNLIPTVKYMMTLMKELTELTGEEKKKLIIEALQEFVRVHDAGHLDVLDPIIINIIPSVIDEFVQLNKEGNLIFTLEKPKARVSKIGRFLCCKKSEVAEPVENKV
jgi:hypothetical protein